MPYFVHFLKFLAVFVLIIGLSVAGMRLASGSAL